MGTCYEYAVTLLVFLKHTDDKDLFDRFADTNLGAEERTKSFGENAEALKWNFDDKTLKSLEPELRKLMRIGKEFLDSEFGWAKLWFR